MSAPRILAAVDFGSNTAGFLVAEIGEGQEPRFLARDSRAVRLAEGLVRDGELGPKVIERALQWTGEMAHRLRDLGVSQLAAVGTEALRRARNAAEFLEPAAGMLGAPVELLSGNEEGRRTFEGVRWRYSEGPLATLDIGGGSTELFAGESAGNGGVRGCSVSVGAVTLSEAHGENSSAMRATLEPLRARFAESTTSTEQLTVLGGTAVNCAQLDRVFGAECDPGQPPPTALVDDDVEGRVLEWERVQWLAARAAEVSAVERTRRFGIPPGRADLAVAAFEILRTAMESGAFRQVRLTRYCLRHGVLQNQLRRESG